MTEDEMLLLECFGALHYSMGLLEGVNSHVSFDWACEVTDKIEKRLTGRKPE